MRRQRSVKVWISAGPRSLTVPALFGESERAAQVRVQENGLQLRSIAEIRTSEYPVGSVVAQSPRPQSRARRSRCSSIAVNVARATSCRISSA